MKVYLLDDFVPDFKRLPKRIRKKARRTMALLEESPFHPSLHTKKMQGTQGVWEARVTISYRITFLWEADQIWLRRIGPHDILRKEN